MKIQLKILEIFFLGDTPEVPQETCFQSNFKMMLKSFKMLLQGPLLPREFRPPLQYVFNLPFYPMIPEGCYATPKCAHTSPSPHPKTYYPLKGRWTEQGDRSSPVIPFYPLGFSNKYALQAFNLWPLHLHTIVM